MKTKYKTFPQEEIDSKIAETEKEALKTTMATNNQISLEQPTMIVLIVCM